MKFRFKTQDYQTDAVDNIIKVFKGQPYKDSVAYLRDLGDVKTSQQITMINGMILEGDGFENGSIDLKDDELLANIKSIQRENNIKESSTLSKPLGLGCKCALDIDMETGTGKTYVYTKAMFELNKVYGWSKFIVVVPSVAIREGVRKSFEQTEDHFFELYGKKARYFIYDSHNLNLIDGFSASRDINVMIINSQAFNSFKEGANNEASRIIYSKQDSFASRKPIDVIAANRPIIILDEPQKLEGKNTQDNLKKFNPLFTINCSATHKTQHNLVYVLDALDAYRQKLVKKIEVRGFELHNLSASTGFVYFSQIILSPDKPPRARVMYDVKTKSGIKRESHILGVNDNLYSLSNYLEEYKNEYTIKDIDPYDDSITFLNGLTLHSGESEGDMTEKDMRRVQIRETILAHFQKEESLFDKGIKCLSLFFIDHVENYRKYDSDGNQVLGEYGKIFEEEYQDILQEYLTVYETPYTRYLKSIDVHDTHNGYFSIDKKTGRCIDSVEKKGVCDDTSAYDLILKNKERLLSFDEPTRFIFSHSALREGWDNPNVFQICTLKQSTSEINKRQEVGRGMRLCVNSEGERQDSTISGLDVHSLNVLTVIASDSYTNFVSQLQSELRENLYDRPVVVTSGYFTGKHIKVNGVDHVVTDKEANTFCIYLAANGYIDYEGSVTNAFKDAVDTNTLVALPFTIQEYTEGLVNLTRAIYDNKIIIDPPHPPVKRNSLNDNFYKKEFQDLWNKINHKYAYTVSFDSQQLIKNCIDAINEKLNVAPLYYVRTIGTQNVDDLDFGAGTTKSSDLKQVTSNVEYDLVGKIAQSTMLTRKTVCQILKGITLKKFLMFQANPEEFISKVSNIIQEQKATLVVDEIVYRQTDEDPYSSDIFTADREMLDITKIVEGKKSVTTYVDVDSDKERTFVNNLESTDKTEVSVYAKLPRRFKIPTPMGEYSPDWAIAFYEGSFKYVYFVAETKGKLTSMQLKPVEQGKIECTKKLFSTLLDGEIKYDVVDSYKTLLDLIKS